jgi:hypothetical protein
MANRNWASGGKVYSMHVSPVLLDCNFIVDSTNGNGLGIRSLKGPCIDAVFMATSATPAAGNPNPAAGTIIVQLADNYNRYYGGFSGQASPIGSPATSTTSGTAAIVTSLGTSTTANWLAVGFPAVYLNQTTMLPNVGAAFIPTSSASIGGGATIAPSATAGSGIDHIELVGDPNQTISAVPSNLVGGQMIFQCFFEGAKTAPANGTVISLSFYLGNSSVMVQGE